ncbi:MAG: hydroxysqualene dehydroxylase HpnE [Acidovorax sp.]
MKAAVIGAGWAGLAAAIAATQAGAEVTLFEAARAPGGRARTLAGSTLDNGQHILIGAYTECLRLMRLVGVQEATALHRQPLALTYPDGLGLAFPDLPPPWDALVGIARARGWSWRDKAALLRTAAAWRLAGFRCAPDATVAGLCARLTPRLMAEFIEPLCISALNTPAHEASGAVFLRVLQDSLFSGPGGSHLLVPRTDLGALFPEAAARWLAERGAHLRWGQRVQSLTPGQVDGEPFDAVLLATPAWEAARLAHPIAPDWAAQAAALRHTAIATVYAHAPTALPAPLLALRGQPAQFVFDRGEGLLAFVVSTSAGGREQIEREVTAQAQAQLGIAITPLQTVVEKRATFACTPLLARPGMAVAPGLWACGDYVDGPYPATLEGAVRSGTAAGVTAVGTAP